MRENRQSGSEGGEPQINAAFLPLSWQVGGKVHQPFPQLFDRSVIEQYVGCVLPLFGQTQLSGFAILPLLCSPTTLQSPLFPLIVRRIHQ